MSRWMMIWVIVFVAHGKPYCQETTSANLIDEFTIPQFPAFGFLLTYFPSHLIGNAIELKSYIRSARFRALRKHFGDVRAVDALYTQSLRLTRGNTAMTLFYCLLVTMDHRLVGIKLPFLTTFVPLTGESLEEFSVRIGNLPTHLYSDSPPSRSGDRDKLQHFFGSAFLANAFESRDAAERVGSFVEWGEEAFIVDGVLDDRDVRANRQGREFGLALINAHDLNAVLPSHFLKLWIAESQSEQVFSPSLMGDHPSRPCGVW